MLNIVFVMVIVIILTNIATAITLSPSLYNYYLY